MIIFYLFTYFCFFDFFWACSHDCGVFTMKFMEDFKAEVDTRKLFSKHDILRIRIQYANRLFLCTRNTADKSLVLDFQHEVCFCMYIYFLFSHECSFHCLNSNSSHTLPPYRLSVLRQFMLLER